MAWDTDHIITLLNEVANTKDHASLRKADELLAYIRAHASKEDSASSDLANDSKKPDADTHPAQSK